MKQVAIQAAKQAGEVLANNFGRIDKVKVKREGSLVTNVDLEAERRIIEVIKKYYPEHTILAEESNQLTGDTQYRWIVDPLDGTHNYIRGIDIFGVCIALEQGEEVILGVIYLPLKKQLYVAKRGEGSFLNGEKITVSQKNLSEACMVHDSSLRLDKEGVMLANLGKLAKKVFNVRMLGSSARSLSYLSEGRVDLVIDYHDSPWDFSAGAIIVEEAGGRVTDIKGNSWHSGSKGYIASNGIIHDEVLGILSSS